MKDETRREVIEALKPFSDGCTEHFNDWCPDETPAWYEEDEKPSIVTVGDFRRARALLSRLEGAEAEREEVVEGDRPETIERNPKSWAAWKREAERLAVELNARDLEISDARHEASCCDDIKLDQPLAGIIADLQAARETQPTLPPVSGQETGSGSRFRKGVDEREDDDKYMSYGITDFAPDDVVGSWTNRIVVYGSALLRDRVLALLSATPPTPSSTDEMEPVAWRYKLNDLDVWTLIERKPKTLPSSGVIEPLYSASTLAAMQGKLNEALRKSEHWHECFVALNKAVVGKTGLSAITVAPKLRERAEAASTISALRSDNARLKQEIERFAGLEAESMEATEVVGELKAKVAVLEAENARLTQKVVDLRSIANVNGDWTVHVATLRAALTRCQGILARFVKGWDDKKASGLDIMSAYAECVAAEAEARSALQEKQG